MEGMERISAMLSRKEAELALMKQMETMEDVNPDETTLEKKLRAQKMMDAQRHKEDTETVIPYTMATMKRGAFESITLPRNTMFKSSEHAAAEETLEQEEQEELNEKDHPTDSKMTRAKAVQFLSLRRTKTTQERVERMECQGERLQVSVSSPGSPIHHSPAYQDKEEEGEVQTLPRPSTDRVKLPQRSQTTTLSTPKPDGKRHLLRIDVSKPLPIDPNSAPSPRITTPVRMEASPAVVIPPRSTSSDVKSASIRTHVEDALLNNMIKSAPIKEVQSSVIVPTRSTSRGLLPGTKELNAFAVEEENSAVAGPCSPRIESMFPGHSTPTSHTMNGILTPPPSHSFTHSFQPSVNASAKAILDFNHVDTPVVQPHSTLTRRPSKHEARHIPLVEKSVNDARRLKWYGKVKEAVLVPSTLAMSEGEFAFEGREKWLFLFSDYLLLASSESRGKSIVDPLKDKLMIQKMIPLSFLTVSKLNEPPLCLTADNVLLPDPYSKPDPYHTLVPYHPKTLAFRLLTSLHKSTSRIGEMLSSRADILEAFLSWFNFHGMRFDVAFRCFCERFKIKSQGSKWDLFADAFARRYVETSQCGITMEMAQEGLAKMFYLNALLRNGKPVPTRTDFLQGFKALLSDNGAVLRSAEWKEKMALDIYEGILYRPLELGSINQRISAFPLRPLVENWLMPKYLIEKRAFTVVVVLSHVDPDYSIQLHGVGLTVEPPVLMCGVSQHTITITPQSTGTKLLMMTDLYKKREIIETRQTVLVVLPSWMDTSVKLDHWAKLQEKSASLKKLNVANVHEKVEQKQVESVMSLQQLGLYMDNVSVSFADVEAKREFMGIMSQYQDGMESYANEGRLSVVKGLQLRSTLKKLDKKLDEIECIKDFSFDVV